MTVKQSLVGILLILACSAGFGILLHLGGRSFWKVPDDALAQTPPQVRTVLLAKDQKLKDANWHCYAAGYCQLWTLTVPRKADEKPQTYLFQSEDGSRQYVIKEQ